MNNREEEKKQNDHSVLDGTTGQQENESKNISRFTGKKLNIIYSDHSISIRWSKHSKISRCFPHLDIDPIYPVVTMGSRESMGHCNKW